MYIVITFLFFSIRGFTFPANPDILLSPSILSETLGGSLMLEVGLSQFSGLSLEAVSDIGSDGDSNINVELDPKISSGSEGEFYLKMGVLSWWDLFFIGKSSFGAQVELMGPNSIKNFSPWSISLLYLKISTSGGESKSGGGIFNYYSRSWTNEYSGSTQGIIGGYRWNEKWLTSLRLFSTSGDLKGTIDKSLNSSSYANAVYNYKISAVIVGVGLEYQFCSELKCNIKIGMDQITAKTEGNSSQNISSFLAAFGYQFDYFNSLLK